MARTARRIPAAFWLRLIACSKPCSARLWFSETARAAVVVVEAARNRHGAVVRVDRLGARARQLGVERLVVAVEAPLQILADGRRLELDLDRLLALRLRGELALDDRAAVAQQAAEAGEAGESGEAAPEGATH